MTTELIRVGVIGCGEIVQMMHLPTLSQHSLFRVDALCDISVGKAAHLAQRYGVPRVTTRAEDIVLDDAIDAVLICTYDHAQIAIAALETGKHVLIEKPAAFTIAEGELIVEAASCSGRVAMVGYMKLYDPALERAVQAVNDGSLGPVRNRTVHDFAGRFDRYQLNYDLITTSDASTNALDQSRTAVEERIEGHLGEWAAWTNLYLLLLMLGSHDLAVLRAMFGTPSRVVATLAVDQRGLISVLEYEDGVPCVFRIGVGTQYEDWDESITVGGDLGRLRVDFAHPYLRQATSNCSMRLHADGLVHDSTYSAPFQFPFVREIDHFAASIQSGIPVRTPVSDAVSDLRLATDMIRALPHVPPPLER